MNLIFSFVIAAATIVVVSATDCNPSYNVSKSTDCFENCNVKAGQPYVLGWTMDHTSPNFLPSLKLMCTKGTTEYMAFMTQAGMCMAGCSGDDPELFVEEFAGACAWYAEHANDTCASDVASTAAVNTASLTSSANLTSSASSATLTSINTAVPTMSSNGFSSMNATSSTISVLTVTVTQTYTLQPACSSNNSMPTTGSPMSLATPTVSSSASSVAQSSVVADVRILGATSDAKNLKISTCTILVTGLAVLLI